MVPTRAGLEEYVKRVKSCEQNWISLFFDGSHKANVKYIISDGKGGHSSEVDDRVTFTLVQTIDLSNGFSNEDQRKFRKLYQTENAAHLEHRKETALQKARACTEAGHRFYWHTANGYASSLLGHIVDYVEFCKSGLDPALSKTHRKSKQSCNDPPTNPPKRLKKTYEKTVTHETRTIQIHTPAANPDHAQTQIIVHTTGPSPPELWPKTREDRLGAYCGNMIALVHHAKKKHGTTGGMSNTQVHNWLKKNPAYIPTWLHGVEFEVDHIISDKVGGIPWPHNFFLMPKQMNRHFREWVDAEKAKYVGDDAWLTATSFSRWLRNKTRALVDFSEFNPVGAQFIGRS
jgi:hypothetical protein